MTKIGTYLDDITGLADSLAIRSGVGLSEREESKMTPRFGA